jgi:hypothetical protein
MQIWNAQNVSVIFSILTKTFLNFFQESTIAYRCMLYNLNLYEK